MNKEQSESPVRELGFLHDFNTKMACGNPQWRRFHEQGAV